LKREGIRIEDICEENFDDLESLYLTEERLSDPLIIEGDLLWKKWMTHNLRRYNSVGKIAYLDSKPVGMIQYVPKPKQRVVEIKWTFVKKEEKNDGIEETLLKETFDEFNKPKRYFDHKKAEAFLAYPASFSNSKDKQFDLYKENGFERISRKNKTILYYYATEDDSKIDLDIDKFPLEKPRDKALILLNPNSPYCVKEAIDTLQEIRRCSDDIPIKLVSRLEEPEEFIYAFSMPISLVVKDKILDLQSIKDTDISDELNKVIDNEKELEDSIGISDRSMEKISEGK